MNILYLTTVIPNQRSGGEIVTESFVKMLCENGCRVTLLGYKRKNDDDIPGDQVVVIGERHIETDKAGWHFWFWLILALLKNKPYSSEKFYSQAYGSKLRELLLTKAYDAVVIEHSQLGWLRSHIPQSCPIIFNTHNIEHEIYEEHFRKTNGLKKIIFSREARLIKRMENRVAQAAKQIWTLTEHDACYFSSVTGVEKVREFGVPSLMNFDRSKLTTSRLYDIGIIGTWSWKSNQDGLVWFFDTIYPLLPIGLSIHVAGKGADWVANKYSNVEYCGFVADAHEFMTLAKVVAIPSVSGGGIQIKTLDAIATGARIVATPVALRGISHYPDTVSECEKPSEFASCLVDCISTSASITTDYAAHWIDTRKNNFRENLELAVSHIKKGN